MNRIKNNNSVQEKNDIPRYQPRVVVKFHDEIDLPYIDNVEEYLERIEDWSGLATDFPGIDISRLFKILEPRQIIELVNRATENDPTYRPPNFLTYFIVDYPDGKNPTDLARALANWESVAEAYVEPKPAPPPSPPTGTNPRRGDQGYLNAADQGINAEYAWNTFGGSGSGMQFIDMEKGWNLNHQDLPQPPNQIPSPIAGFSHSDQGHGTATLGVVVAVDNSVGGIGIAYDASARVVSEIMTGGSTNKADAIMAAMYFLMSMPDEEYKGSVLLLESQSNLAVPDPEDVSDPTDDSDFLPGEGFAPIEVYSAEFHAIELTTANGIVVIEPAGNAVKEDTTGPYIGPVNLDELRKKIGGALPGKRILYDPLPPTTNSDYQESGAIMVGAATSGIPHDRTQDPPPSTSHPIVPGPPSNYGSRVDCYAWGEAVTTCGSGSTITGYPTIDNSAYTNAFSGTSSAAAIIAGVALVVQGIAKANSLGSNSNGTYTPTELRAILRNEDNGTVSNDPANDLIGVMPDLKKIINDEMGLEPDIFLRDFVGSPSLGDDIGDPHTGPISSSPDIIVRNTQIANYDNEFGQGSTNQNLNGLGEAVLNDGSGSDKYIYVRVTNRGASLAKDVDVTVYWSEVATLLTPATWHEIGSTTLASIPPGEMRVCETIWEDTAADPIPPAGHYCFVGIVSNARDLAPDPLAISTWNEYHSFIRDYNNVTWCNFNVEEMPPPPSPPGPGEGGAPEEPDPGDGGAGGNGEGEDLIILPFLATGAQFEDLPMQLEVGAQLPEGAQLWLEGPENFMVDLQGKTACLGVVQKLLRILSRIFPAKSARLKMDDSLEGNKEKRIKRVAVNPRGRHPFRDIPFQSNLREQMRLVVNMPDESRQQSYEIFVRQLHNREEVGRVTWRLVPPDRMRPLAPKA
jgi:hypothetical protein